MQKSSTKKYRLKASYYFKYELDSMNEVFELAENSLLQATNTSDLEDHDLYIHQQKIAFDLDDNHFQHSKTSNKMKKYFIFDHFGQKQPLQESVNTFHKQSESFANVLFCKPQNTLQANSQIINLISPNHLISPNNSKTGDFNIDCYLNLSNTTKASQHFEDEVEQKEVIQKSIEQKVSKTKSSVKKYQLTAISSIIKQIIDLFQKITYEELIDQIISFDSKSSNDHSLISNASTSLTIPSSPIHKKEQLNIKRRACEALRVFTALNLITIQNQLITANPFVWGLSNQLIISPSSKFNAIKANISKKQFQIKQRKRTFQQKQKLLQQLTAYLRRLQILKQRNVHFQKESKLYSLPLVAIFEQEPQTLRQRSKKHLQKCFSEEQMSGNCLVLGVKVEDPIETDNFGWCLNEKQSRVKIKGKSLHFLKHEDILAQVIPKYQT